MNEATFLGRFPERLTLDEHRALAGQWLAFELYDPQTLPLRVIAAVGHSAADCASRLRERGADPAKHEYVLVQPPY